MPNSSHHKEDHPVLPLLYQRWMDDLLNDRIPPEKTATCHCCAMLPADGEAPVSQVYFKSDARCCTFLPRLPNFIAGRILDCKAAGADSGRSTVLKRMEDKRIVTPLGLTTTPDYDKLDMKTKEEAFGRVRSQVCPHFDHEAGDRCAIWRHRHSMCATWFCKHDRGAVGRRFWQSLRHLLKTVEDQLSVWCLVQSGLENRALSRLLSEIADPEEPKALKPADLDAPNDPQQYEAYWGSWTGREAAFYIQCSRRVSKLTWAEVVSICGPTLSLRTRLLQQAFNDLLSQKLPRRLQTGEFNLMPVNDKMDCITAYSGYDRLNIPKVLVQVLHEFNGRTTQEALEIIQEKYKLALNESAVRRLADFEILVPAPDK